jgi:hypothetical protein
MIRVGTIANYKPAINTILRDKRREGKAAGYRFIPRYNTDSKMHVCMTGGTRY